MVEERLAEIESYFKNARVPGKKLNSDDYAKVLAAITFGYLGKKPLEDLTANSVVPGVEEEYARALSKASEEEKWEMVSEILVFLMYSVTSLLRPDGVSDKVMDSYCSLIANFFTKSDSEFQKFTERIGVAFKEYNDIKKEVDQDRFFERFCWKSMRRIFSSGKENDTDWYFGFAGMDVATYLTGFSVKFKEIIGTVEYAP